jgi:hypothetical protein
LAQAQEDSKKPEAWQTLNGYFREALACIGCFKKQKAFEGEDEIRLLLHALRYRENSIKFRTVRSTLIPDVAVEISGYQADGPASDFNASSAWNAIQTVVIGPTSHMELTEQSVRAFFALKGMRVLVRPSDVPYRDW